MKRALWFLDSKLLTRVAALITLITLGLGLVGLMRAQVADLIGGAGWAAAVCFGIWAALALLLTISWLARRRPSTI